MSQGHHGLLHRCLEHVPGRLSLIKYNSLKIRYLQDSALLSNKKEWLPSALFEIVLWYPTLSMPFLLFLFPLTP